MTETPPGLAWRRALAAAILTYEGLLPALLPAALVAGAFLLLALLDIPPMLPWWAHLGLLGVTGLAILALAARGLARWHSPDANARDRWLERASGLDNRPLSALTDRPAADDPLSLAIWRAHVARGMARIQKLKLRWPHPGLASRDRRASRLALCLGLLVALVVAGRDAPSRVWASLTPPTPRTPAPLPVDVRVWATPPAYIGQAPIVLKRDQGAVSVPVGSRLTVSVSGGATVPVLSWNDTRTPFLALDQTSFQAEGVVSAGGKLLVERDGAPFAAWDIAAIPDAPPTAAWTAPPGPSTADLHTRFPWSVSDDHGVTALMLELRLAARPDAPVETIEIPIPGTAPKTAHGLHQPDLTAHPWSGLEVTARLTARDGAGQTGVSEDASVFLPERVFRNEIARALIQMRKDLSLHPDDRGDVMEGLDRYMQQPELFDHDAGAYLNLSAIYYLLLRNKSPARFAEAQSRMWDLALHLEEGQAEETARILEAARQAARDAMENQAQSPSDANRAQLEQRLQELRDAIERHMRAMMEEAERNHTALPFDPEAEQLTTKELDRLTEEASQAAREGRMDEARQKMEDLEKLLERLREARADKGKGNSQERQKGRRQMGVVQDLVAREGGLLDRTESRVDETAHPRPAQPGSGDQRQTDQRFQLALRHALGEMMQQFGDLTHEVPPALTEADQAMREAGKLLGLGDDPGASAAEQTAIAALQKGAKEMGQTLSRQFGRGQPGGEQGDGPDFGAEGPPEGAMMREGRGDQSGGSPIPGHPRSPDPKNRDPLGRTNQGGGLNGDDVRVPEEAERQRTRAIQEELRRRGAERERPRRELDYIDRLLRRF